MTTRSPQDLHGSVVVDTNIILRWILDDVPDQAEAATRIWLLAADGVLARVCSSISHFRNRLHPRTHIPRPSALRGLCVRWQVFHMSRWNPGRLSRRHWSTIRQRGSGSLIVSLSPSQKPDSPPPY